MMGAGLTDRQQAVIAIAGHAAAGDKESSIRALERGLDSGLTVNEIGEVLLQLYAYAGFPRSLNGIADFATVLDGRRRRGVDDSYGLEPRALPGDADRYAVGAANLSVLAGVPIDRRKAHTNGYNEAIDAFLKEHLFADIFGRDNLSFDTRELATLGALCSLQGTNPQVLFHMNAAMNVGITEAQMWNAVEVIGAEFGAERGDNAESVLRQVLDRRHGTSGEVARSRIEG